MSKKKSKNRPKTPSPKNQTASPQPPPTETTTPDPDPSRFPLWTVPVAVLAGTCLLLVLAYGVTSSLFGQSLQNLQNEAAPLAREFVTSAASPDDRTARDLLADPDAATRPPAGTVSQNNRQNPPADLVDTPFSYPAFRQTLVQTIGPIQEARAGKTSLGPGDPPTLVVALDVRGEKGPGTVSVVLEGRPGALRVTRALATSPQSDQQAEQSNNR